MLTAPDPYDHETRALFRRFGEIDWDFPAQASESPFSAVHWHPCRFPSQIPALAIGRMCPPRGLVLDPFMGSATTLVEAQRLGRPSVGIDLNPVSCLVGTAKTLVAAPSEIRHTINGLKLAVSSSWDTIAPATLPSTVQADKWYMPGTLTDLRKLWCLASDADGISGVIARGCFSAILLSACREDRHWGYVCDNTRPKSERAPDGKGLFLAALQRLMVAYDQRPAHNGSVYAGAQIINDDAAAALSKLPADYVDCVVTSPPYFGVTDYVKAQRLTMEWFSNEIEGFAPPRDRSAQQASSRNRTRRVSARPRNGLSADSSRPQRRGNGDNSLWAVPITFRRADGFY
jgi:hypothetical protein